MKVHLAFSDRRLDPQADPPDWTASLVPDLGLDIVFQAMAGSDAFVGDISRRVVLNPLTSPEAIRYRQAAVQDALDRPEEVRALYALVSEALDRHLRAWGLTPMYPTSVLYWASNSLQVLIPMLRRLRVLAVGAAGDFRSPAFTRLFDEIAANLDEDYLSSINRHLERLRFRKGITVSAGLGQGNRGAGYVLRRPNRRGWRSLVAGPRSGRHVYRVHPKDDKGAQMLDDVRAHGTMLAAAVLGRSTDHIVAYFTQLRVELAFLVGCLNLRDRLAALGRPTCLPEPEPPGSRALTARGLYDAALALASRDPVVGNDLSADGRLLLLVTGANRGGKSTFLRSLGIAQLLMQAGMFVPGDSFRAEVRGAVFSHFKREEDAGLQSGKLAEELGRLRWIIDRAGPDSLILLNESFASTNEREGSEIGRQVVGALLDAGVRVAFVTHLHELAVGLGQRDPDAVLQLRAERLADGRRTFRVVEGEALPSSHGEDIYRRVFGPSGAAAEPSPPLGRAAAQT